MTLEQLRIFVAVAERQHMTRAAEDAAGGQLRGRRARKCPCGPVVSSRRPPHRGRSLLATQWQILLRILLPAAVPTIVAGFRLGLTFALIAVISLEFLLYSGGLGKLVSPPHILSPRVRPPCRLCRALRTLRTYPRPQTAPGGGRKPSVSKHLAHSRLMSDTRLNRRRKPDRERALVAARRAAPWRAGGGVTRVAARPPPAARIAIGQIDARTHAGLCRAAAAGFRDYR